MIGSVFSPYYAWSGRHNPQNHVGLNVGLYGGGKKRWTLTERGEADLEQSRHTLRIGPSNLEWDGNRLIVHIDERASPLFQKVKGTIKLTPEAMVTEAFDLSGDGRHFWQPLGAVSHAEVEFSNPSLSWSGKAYMDSNWGIEPLETGFEYWDWSRAHTKNGAGIFYDAFTRSGENRQLALAISSSGEVEHVAIPPRQSLSRGTIWRVRRSTLKSGTGAKTLKMLEDTPFYTRSQIATEFAGEDVVAVHESLDCDLFAKQWVRCLLPFRMPRRATKTR